MRPRKEEALSRFVRGLEQHLGDKVWGLYLFGSVAKGTDTPESDIDVLVVYSGGSKKEVEGIVDELAFDIACETGEGLETILMSEEEYKTGTGRSPFLWEVLQFGKVLLARSSSTKWSLQFEGYLTLAQEYLNYAKDAKGENKTRLAIDAAYNAAELLVKALIISAGKGLASSHGGIVGQFGKLFVLSREVDAQFGKGLNKSLRLRGQARYEPMIELTPEDAEFVIALTENLLTFAQKRLKIN